jgi:hypothetical protein
MAVVWEVHAAGYGCMKEARRADGNPRRLLGALQIRDC